MCYNSRPMGQVPYKHKAICRTGRINDSFTEDGRPEGGSFAFKFHKVAKIPGNWYAPFYFMPQHGCYVCFYFQCKAATCKTHKRKDQQICQNMIPYYLIIMSCTRIPDTARFYERLPDRVPLPAGLHTTG